GLFARKFNRTRQRRVSLGHCSRRRNQFLYLFATEIGRKRCEFVCASGRIRTTAQQAGDESLSIHQLLFNGGLRRQDRRDLNRLQTRSDTRVSLGIFLSQTIVSNSCCLPPLVEVGHCYFNDCDFWIGDQLWRQFGEVL